MNTSNFVKWYMKQRGMKTPDAKDAYIFLVSEVGELGDAMLRLETEAGWVRNNPDKDSSISDELADCFQMLTILADSYGIDLEAALTSKVGRKLQEHHDNK